MKFLDVCLVSDEGFEPPLLAPKARALPGYANRSFLIFKLQVYCLLNKVSTFTASISTLIVTHGYQGS